MTHLLELPSEVIQNICAILIRDYGLQIAVHAFDSEIVRAIILMKALESPGHSTRHFSDNRVLVEYLWFRTKTDHTHQHPVTTVIHDTVDFLIRKAPKVLPPKDQLLREACSAIVLLRHRRPFNGYQPFDMVRKVLSLKRRSCSCAQNALVLAAHLGLISVVQQLLEDGVEDSHSDFGFAIECIANQKNPFLISIYLQMKLDIAQKRLKDNPSDRTLTDEPETCSRRASDQRDISIVRYILSMIQAAAHSVPETVELLVDALCEDQEHRPKSVQPRCFLGNNTGWVTLSKLRADIMSIILITAALHGRLDMAKMALNNGADPKHTTFSHCARKSALSAAAVGGHLEMFELLLKYGANMCIKLYRPLLYYALIGGSPDIVKICLDSCTSSFSRSKCREKPSDKHPLMVAVSHKRLATCHTMLQVLFTHNIVFEPDSELYQELCKVATSFGDVHSLALLERIRKEQQAIIGLNQSNIND